MTMAPKDENCSYVVILAFLVGQENINHQEGASSIN
jgi:hypothetical protein